jgi:hypothetical protein
VPESAGAVVVEFPPGIGPLLPTGHVRDTVAGIEVTCYDRLSLPLPARPANSVGFYHSLDDILCRANLESDVERALAGAIRGVRAFRCNRGDPPAASYRPVDPVANRRDEDSC